MTTKKKLEIKYVKINEITPCEENPRIISDEAVEKVAESIRNFGFKQPIIVDNNMIIIAGHTRYSAAQILGLKEVPIIVVTDLSKEQVNAFRIADNKTAEYSEWDKEGLADIFKALEEAGFNVEQTGFNMEDVEKILSSAEEEMEDLILEKDDSDVANSTVKKVVFGKYKCVLSDEEFEKLEKVYLDYVESNTTSYGFITFLLKDVE